MPFENSIKFLLYRNMLKSQSDPDTRFLFCPDQDPIRFILKFRSDIGFSILDRIPKNSFEKFKY